MLTKLALRGRILTLLIMVAVIAGGVFSLMKLQIELLPDIEFPALTVSALYPDASPDDVLNDVTIPIEGSLEGIDELTNVQTISAPSVSQVIIQTDFGEDMSALEAEITRRLEALDFPEGVTPEVARINPDEFPVIELAVVGDDDITELVAMVEGQVIPAIESVPGVFAADIPLGLAEGASIARANGRPAVTLSILKEPDANTVDVANAVEEKLDELEATLPAGSEFIEISNQAPPIQASIDELTQHVLYGAVFAVVVMFAFLLSVRPTLISSVAIPVSVFAALIVMQLQGMSLNILTLGGLAIAVGRVVDDSIVVIENIFRHIQAGESPRSAAINGAREVTVPITASTLTTVAVFAPLALIGGFIGIIFQPFALVVTYSLLASLIVALTIVPVLATMFIKSAKEHRENVIERVYTRLVRGALKRRWRTIGGAAALTLLALFLLPFIPVNFIGSADSGALTIRVTVPDATERDEVLAELEAVEQVLTDMAEAGTVEAFSANYGGSNVFGGLSSANSASLQVALAEGTDTEEIAESLRQTLPTEARQVAVSTVAAGGPDSSALELILRGDNYAAMLEAADQYTELISQIDGVVNVSHNGIDTSAGGGLAALAPIIRVDGERAITISGTITSDNTGAVNVEVERIKAENPLPAGVEVATGGVFEDINEAFTQMGIAMAISVVLVYVVMVVTQRSFVIPFVIVLSLPLALIGAFGALFITQRALGLPALMGLLMLIGLVVTNAIVLIAFVEQLRARGMGMYDALVEGGRTRLRPILMTAFTTTFVLVPMALSLGGGEGGGIIGAELATVVIGGILASTFLTLVVLPVVYSFLRKKGPKLTAQSRMVAAGEAGAPAGRAEATAAGD